MASPRPARRLRETAGRSQLSRHAEKGTGLGYARVRIDEHPGDGFDDRGRALATARQQLDRLTPAEALKAQQRGAFLVDLRSDGQRVKDGKIPAAIVIQRNVLEWRLDPSSPYRDPCLAKAGEQVILVCNEGYQSSLAAATLWQFGLDATDVIGGTQAWRAARLPLSRQG